jgi:hypothetical protein
MYVDAFGEALKLSWNGELRGAVKSGKPISGYKNCPLPDFVRLQVVIGSAGMKGQE